MSTRRIERLEIEGLFGRFNYAIGLGVEKRGLKILTSPNGYGKSTILRMIDAFARGEYEYFTNEKFDSVRFILSGGLTVELISKAGDVLIKCEDKSVLIRGGDNKRNKKGFFVEPPLESRVARSRFLRDELAEGFVDKDIFYEICKELRSYADFLENESWLEEIREELKVISISTNRLKTNLPDVSSRSDKEGVNIFTVDYLARKLKTRIQQEIGRQFNEGRQLEASFPTRLIAAMRRATETSQERPIQDEIDRVKDYETRFIKLGLVHGPGSEDQIKALNVESLGDPEVVVLRTYLSDILKKFKLLDELVIRLEVFCNSINELLAFKSISTSEDDGIVVRVSDREGESIPLSLLSSGEQHLIVIIGELVFNTDENCLVLIDEPEISFHPGWQEKFLGILENIQRVNAFSVLVSTHSPMLIGDRWDSVIELASQN